MKKITLVPAIALALASPAVAQLSLNVRDADIRAFIADAAQATGRTFIIDNRVNGKVTVVTDHPLSKSQYFEIFLSTLRANGLVAVPTSGGAFRIQPIDNAASQPTPVGSRAAARDSFITDIVRLRSIDAQSALDTVKPLVSPQGSVTANKAGNSLVIVDFADNVHRIRQVIAGIDTDQASTRVVPLKNAGAREIATALKGLIGDGGGQNGTPGVQVVSVDSSNSVVLRGDPNTVSRLATVAAQLDQKAEAGTEIRVVFLENADAAQLLPVLQELVGEQPSAIPDEDQAITSNFLSQSGSGSSGVSQLQPSANRTSTPTPTPAASQSNSNGENGTNKPAIVGEGGRTAAVVTRFAGANAIVIAGPPEVQRQLSEVIRQLDTRRQQVLVEAVVAEVSDNAAKQLGVQFLLGNLKGGAFAATNYSTSAPSLLSIAGAIGARKLATSTTTVTDGGTTITGQDTTISDQLAQSAVSSILGTNGGFFGGGAQIGDTILGGIINAVKSDTQSNLLQSPSVVMLDNTPSHLLVGQEVPITTGKALSDNFDNAFQTIQRENVGIELDVKPQINSSGTIKLFLHQTVSSIAGPVSSDNSELIINKREVQTTMTVDDGQIAVIGGLLDDNERRTLEKIPYLSDIPLLGNLFKSHSKSHTKTNLMIFIRPTILRTADDTQKVTEQRYGYLRAVQGQMNPDQEPSIDQLVRDYMGAAPPTPPAPLPGNIHDPQIMVPTVRSSTEVIRPAKREQ
ncbi:type II secretion system secretin GspD [Hephaestia mangrovi]|uniref:type II secretion system secretin GspD n=1 Tax=Hephaestia mangrovi TaxID=2873268 RepID=UPI001CA6D521|nr:type II secretion system secretin GspD [Hephaestia mangrovi]MBY8827531.1 type II secretion system secretin GspD [Hephaestia mangrovi]